MSHFVPLNDSPPELTLFQKVYYFFFPKQKPPALWSIGERLSVISEGCRGRIFTSVTSTMLAILNSRGEAEAKAGKTRIFVPMNEIPDLQDFIDLEDGSYAFYTNARNFCREHGFNFHKVYRDQSCTGVNISWISC